MLSQIAKTSALFLMIVFVVYIFGDILDPLSFLEGFESIVKQYKDQVVVWFWVFIGLFSYIFVGLIPTSIFLFFILFLSTIFVIIFWNLTLLWEGFLWVFSYSQGDKIDTFAPFFEWKFVFVMFSVSSLYFLWSFIYFLRRYSEGVQKGFLLWYMVFIVLLFLWYFGFYVDYDIRKIELVDESYFVSTNKEVKDSDNMAIALYDFWKILSDEKTFLYEIRNQIDPFEEWFDVSKIKNLNKQTIDKIESLQWDFSVVSEKKYFKKWEYITYSDVISLFMKYISFYNTIYHIEQWNTREGLTIMSQNYRVWTSLMNGQGEFIDSLFWVKSQSLYFSHIEYILDSYSLDNKDLLYLKSFLEEDDFSRSFGNMVKAVLHENLQVIKGYIVYPSIFFDKELYINVERYIFKNIIEGNTGALDGIWNFSEYHLKDSYLTRTLFIDIDYFEGFREDINEITKKREQVISKIDSQVKRRLLLERFKK